MPSPFPNPFTICYFNSLLQCILAAIKKKKLLASSRDPINLHTAHDMCKRLEAKNIAFSFEGQQCAGEAYSMMQIAYEDFPAFSNLFFYTSLITIKCTNCAVKKQIKEKNNIFIIENHETAHSSIFAHEEEIDYKCDKCGSGRSIKKTTLQSPPDIIVYQVKINNEQNKVSFPREMLINGGRWEAVGFVHHYGTNSGGHYKACVQVEKKWWIADDEDIKLGNLNKGSISMAFYSRSTGA